MGDVAAGSGNTDFVSTKMNLVNCPDVQTLHRKVSNIEKKSCHSEKAGISDLSCLFKHIFCYLWHSTNLPTSFGLTTESINPSGPMIRIFAVMFLLYVAFVLREK